MNESWTWRPLEELFEIGAGKTMSAAARNGVNKTPFLRTSNVLWDCIDLSSIDEMSISERDMPAKLLHRGDLLVCEGGEIGRAAIWDGEIETISFQNHLHRLRPIVEDVEPRFYVYFLQSAFTQLGIYEGAGNKTTIPNLSRSRLAALEVPQPKIGEQQAIAAALARVREAIKSQGQSVKLAEELKRAAMQSIFTRGLHGELQKETEIGPVPQSWSETTLRKLCEGPEGSIQTGPFGSQLHKDDYQETGVPVVNPTHLSAGRIGHENVPRVSSQDAHRLQRHQLEAADILFARRGQIGRMALVTEAEKGWLCGTGCFLVRVRQPFIDNRFLAHLFSSEPHVRWLHTHAAGAVMPNLNNAVLGRTPVFIPDIAEQREIIAILDAIERKIDLHRRKHAVLDDLFKALLHNLMAGQIRISDLNPPLSLQNEPKAGQLVPVAGANAGAHAKQALLQANNET